MEDSTVAGEHMTRKTFLGALALTERLEGEAWRSGIPRRMLISGGEATEHPDAVWFLETVIERGFDVILITNGMWLEDAALRAAILRPEWKRLMVQVTNDPRFYPKQPSPSAIPADDPRVVYVPTLSVLIPLGRMKPARARLGKDGVPTRKGPSSFNLRSLTRSLGDVRAALTMLRARAAMGMAGNCSPSISQDGTIVAGETSNCFVVGNVHSTAEEVTRAIVNMRCNKCGLVDDLPQEHKIAIGEARIQLR
jgi:hypothetical protein